MKRKFRILAISLTIVILLVVGVSAVAFAAGPEDVGGSNGYCGGPRAGNGERGIIYNDEVTDLLGLTSEEIREQRLEGKSLVEIAAAQGVSEEELLNTILAVKEEFLQEKLQDGTLTQEQYEQRLETMKQNIQEAINRTATGPAAFGNQGNPGTCPCGGSGPMMQRGTGSGWGTPGQGMGPGMMQRFGRGNG